MGKIIPVTGSVSKAAVRGAIDSKANLAKLNKVLERKAKKKVAFPMRNEARIHYANAIDNVVSFMEESGIDNEASGNQTYIGTSASGMIIPFRSLRPWDPLSEPYAKKKRNPSMWRNKDDLAGYAQAERDKNKVFASKVKSVKETKSFFSRSLGKFTFDLRFQKLHPVFSEMVQKAFVTGTKISPSSLLPIIPMNRKSLSRVMFLERYTSKGTRGGRGRPMITSIAGTLGKQMIKDLSALKLGKLR